MLLYYTCLLYRHYAGILGNEIGNRNEIGDGNDIGNGNDIGTGGENIFGEGAGKLGEEGLAPCSLRCHQSPPSVPIPFFLQFFVAVNPIFSILSINQFWIARLVFGDVRISIYDTRSRALDLLQYLMLTIAIID